jgi:uncharacterized Zn finger protein (UPF0148 family)
MSINLTCPNCGAAAKADDEKLFVFCEACGTRIDVAAAREALLAAEAEKEKEKVKNDFQNVITKAVAAEIEGTKLTEDLKEVTRESALLALDNGDGEEAFAAFSALAGEKTNNWEARLYKGLSAALTSAPLNLRIKEGITAAKNASVENYTGENKKQILSDFSARVRAFVKQYFSKYCVHEKDYVFADANAAKDHFESLHQLSEYLECVNDMFTQEMLLANPDLEEPKRGVINEGLVLAGEITKPIVYLVGYKNTTDKNGQVVAKRVEQKMNSPYADAAKTLTEKLKNAFNTLPSTVNRIKKYDEEIEANRKVVSDYKQALDSYFATNPEDGKVYRRPRLFVRKKTLEEIEAKFPEDLAEKKAASAKSDAAVTKLTLERKKFIKENTK